MINYYYMIWVDAISRLKAVNGNNNYWKFYSMISITLAMSMNLLILLVLFEKYVFNIQLYNLDLHHFIGVKLNVILGFILKYFSIPFVLNYFLIFRNKRYEQLLKKYKTFNGKLAATYIVGSYFLPIVLLIIAFLIKKLVNAL